MVILNKHMHVDKIRAPASIHSNRRRHLPSFSKFESNTSRNSHVIISQTGTECQKEQTLPLPTQKLACGLSIGIFTLTLAHSKGFGPGRAHFDC